MATFFGTYDSCGFEKDGCYLYRAFWKNEPIVHLVSSWNRCYPSKTPIKVMVYTNCEEVEVILNGNSVGKKKADLYEQVSFKIHYEQGQLKAIGYKEGKIVVQDTQLTSGKAKALELESVFPSLKSAGYDAAIINVKLVDEFGTVLPDADDLVTFEVKNGIILGVGNGNPNSHEPDIASYRRLFHGKAQLILKASGNETVYIKAYTKSGYESNLQIPVELSPAISYIDTIEEKTINNWKLYYKLFDELPDPKMKTEDNDMNSFEPVEFNGNPQPELSGKLHKYAMYRTRFNLDHIYKLQNLYFADIRGAVYIYLDGNEIATRTYKYDGNMIIPLDNIIEGEYELTVIIKNENV